MREGKLIEIGDLSPFDAYPVDTHQITTKLTIARGEVVSYTPAREEAREI